MADEDKSTSTVDTETEELETSTDTEAEEQKSEASEDKATSADESGDDQGDEDESGDQGDDEGDDSDTKKQNRSGYLIRQLSNNNPNIQALRATLQPWVDDAEDNSVRKDRQRDINDYIRDAATAQDSILRDNEQVAREIPIFNAGSPEFNRQLTERAYAQYARDHLVYDQNGAKDPQGNPVIIGTRMRLIDFMREKAEDYGFGSTKSSGQGKQQKSGDKSDKSKKANAKMDAAADTVGGASNSGGKGKDEEDPFLKGFDNPYESTHANGGSKPNNAHAWSEK